MDEELQQFKTCIDLREFAAALGYELDRRASSRNSAVMRHPGGDKIIVARNESGDWIFFSVRDDRANGTIIDFVQHLDGVSLGRVRQILRSWMGSPRPVGIQLPMFAKDLEPITRDRAAVVAVWERAKNCFSLPYLTSRGLGPDVLMHPRFAGRVRTYDLKDEDGNVLFYNNVAFPHYDKGGLCGFEIKNKGFTGFASGGVKGLWFSQALPTDRQLVLVESGIDALSYHILHPDELWTRYMSTGGEMNPQQPVLLRGAMEKLPKGAVVLLAFDNDEGGEKLVQEVEAVAPSGRELRRVLPPVGKDWNDTLKHRLGLT